MFAGPNNEICRLWLSFLVCSSLAFPNTDVDAEAVRQ